MIITVTLCPKLDIVYHADKPMPSMEGTTGEAFLYAAGDGIVASRILSRLSVENRAMFFSGGETGKAIEHILKNRNMEYEVINASRPVPVRTLIMTESGEGYSVRSSGFSISQTEGDGFLTQFSLGAGLNDCVILSAALPGGITLNYIKRLIEICCENGALCAVDATGADLRDLTGLSFFLLKIRRDALERHFDTPIGSIRQGLSLCRHINGWGINTVLLDMGSDGLIYSTLGTAYLIPWKRADSFGDETGGALLAGFAAGMSLGLLPSDCFKMAAACAELSQKGALVKEPSRGEVFEHMSCIKYEGL